MSAAQPASKATPLALEAWLLYRPTDPVLILPRAVFVFSKRWTRPIRTLPTIEAVINAQLPSPACSIAGKLSCGQRATGSQTLTNGTALIHATYTSQHQGVRLLVTNPCPL